VVEWLGAQLCVLEVLGSNLCSERGDPNTVEPLITDTAGEFQFCPL
jgi:hypothetical protein